MKPIGSASAIGPQHESQRSQFVRVKSAANLREGPGTDYAIVDKAAAGEMVEIIGRDQHGNWVNIGIGGKEMWIAAFLLDTANLDGIPTKLSAAPTVTRVASISMGVEADVGGWRMKVVDVRRHASLSIGQDFNKVGGNFAVAILSVTNLGTHSDFFDLNGRPIVMDGYNRLYQAGFTSSENAEWRYCPFTVTRQAEPNETICVAFAFDIPDGAGDLVLVRSGTRFSLGNFDELPVE